MKKGRFSHLCPVAMLGLLLVPAMALAMVAHGRKSETFDDQIDVISHLDLQNASVKSLQTSEHWRRQFLELQDPTDGLVTIVDVTDAAHPSIVRQLHLPAGEANSTVDVLVGNVALLRGTDRQSPAKQIGSVSVVSFADPDHPATLRTFHNVSALKADEDRGLIYLVNKHGLWILRQKPATDEALQEAYYHHVLYDH